MTEQVLVPTRERLLRSARELIEEGGYGAASVVAIADRAGVASGTLYRHFPSKQELFAQVFRAVCAGEERAMRDAAERMSARPAPERLEVVLATFAQRALRNPRLAWALIAEPVDPLVDAERLAYRERYAQVIAEALRAGIAAGESGPTSASPHPPTSAAAVSSTFCSGSSPASSGRPADDEVVEALRTFVRRAVGAA